MPGRFLRVACPACEHEQTLFERASTVVTCSSCGETLATPTGGKADVAGSILEVVASR